MKHSAKTSMQWIIAASTAVLVLAACSRSSQGDVAATTEAGALPAEDAAMSAQSSSRVASVKFGRYVEPKTFVVGGVATRFRSGDRLFAAVQLEGSAHKKAVVDIRIRDASGQLVVERSRSVEPKTNETKVNFELTAAEGQQKLPPGTYKAETLLDGELVNTTDLSVE